MRRTTDAGIDRGRARPARLRLHAPGVVLFLSFLDVFALLPTVAPHVASLGAGPIGLGITVAAYSAANLPANVVGGILIDRVGRRRILLVGLLLAAAVVAAYPLAASVPAVVVARLLHGVAGGILTPAVFAVAGDRVRRDEAGRAFGRLGALIGLAAVVAPAAAGVVRQAAGTNAVFLGVAAALLLAAVITVGWIRDVPGAPSPSAPVPPEAPVGSPGATATSRPERLTIRPLLADARLRRGLVAAAVMLSPLSGRIDRRATSRVAAAGLGVLTLSLVTLAAATGLPLLVLGAALFGAGYGLVFPAVAGVTSTTADLRTRGRAFGLFNAAFSVGIAAGPPLVGLLVEHLPAAGPFAPTAALTGAVAVALARR